MKRLDLDKQQLFLIHYIAKGYLAPVDKLINMKELTDIIESYKFHDELYSLPYMFFVKDKQELGPVDCFYDGKKVCTLDVESYYYPEMTWLCRGIFGTTDEAHPGVKELMRHRAYTAVSGTIHDYDSTVVMSLGIPYIVPFSYKTVVFQSRNPAHKAHEYIVNKFQGNLLYSTPYETVKGSDYSFDKKIKVYELMRKKYDVDLLVTLLPRVFAGPREALQNVLLFKNFGCDKFVMGRGKNCVGNFYDENLPYIFCEKHKRQTGVEILFQDAIKNNGVMLRASEIKNSYLDKGIAPPEEMMSKDISELLSA